MALRKDIVSHDETIEEIKGWLKKVHSPCQTYLMMKEFDNMLQSIQVLITTVVHVYQMFASKIPVQIPTCDKHWRHVITDQHVSKSEEAPKLNFLSKIWWNVQKMSVRMSCISFHSYSLIIVKIDFKENIWTLIFFEEGNINIVS